MKAYVKALPDDSVAPKVRLEEVIKYQEEEQRRIAMINAQAQMMDERANQFIMSDLDTQAEQLAAARKQVEAEQAEEEPEIEGEEEYAEKEAELDEQIPEEAIPDDN